MPEWLRMAAAASLIIGGVSSLIMVLDLARPINRQHMWIMNLVWPITGLYAGPLALWAYYLVGRLSTRKAMQEAKKRGEQKLPGREKPFWQSAGLAATHCGSGCTLGDICAEWLIVLSPFSLFGKEIFGAWALDFTFAFAFGIAFQYFTIVPMKKLSPGKGLVEALKADTLSLTCWQLGMYGWMAVATFAIFGRELAKTDPVFWFMMQIAMLFGFMTAYPMNWWLLRRGIKEKM
jgi:hypothetical protein